MSIRHAFLFSLAASLWGRGHSAARGGPGFREQGFGASLPTSPRLRSLRPHSDGLSGFVSRESGAQVPAAKVSVEQLQHPLSRKAAGLLRQAQNFAAMGRHDKAIAQLQGALKESSAIPYAHSMLGVEYLKTNQVPAAITELEQAVTLLPRNAADRSNLAYALLLTGDLDRSEREIRQALDLDRANPKTRFVLNEILSARR